MPASGFPPQDRPARLLVSEIVGGVAGVLLKVHETTTAELVAASGKVSE